MATSVPIPSAFLRHLPLGTQIVFDQVLAKDYTQQLIPRRMREELITSYKPKGVKPAVGTYIGYRFLQEGYTEYTEDSREWIQLGTILCALVVTNPRKNPIHVPPACIVRLDD